jgi:hypothetical protein
LLQALQQRAADSASALQRLRIHSPFFQIGGVTIGSSHFLVKDHICKAQVQSWPLMPLEAYGLDVWAERHNPKQTLLFGEVCCL